MRAPDFRTGLDLAQAFDLTAGSVFSGFVSREYGTFVDGIGLPTDAGIASFALRRLTVGPAATAVPEPGTLALLGLGLLAVAVLRRRRS